MGVAVTLSMAGNVGRRCVRFFRMVASWAMAVVLKMAKAKRSVCVNFMGLLA
jgi:hypothetical protein